ncbi:MAG: right-handed parallel beta-helix repeat-containing protein [Opitutales bacterium]|nr:right-handed parallel beta-helix repeat-containing protein [Opitutales bacterium]
MSPSAPPSAFSPVFNILDFGAVSDGKTVNTAAIQSAFDAVKASGGGCVVVPPGTFVTGSLVVHSHTELWLMPGSVLQGSGDLNDYIFNGPVPQSARDPFKNPAMQDRHLLLLHRAHGVTIRGPGVIDGNGEAFWNPPGSNPNGPMYKHWWTHRNWQRPCPMMSFVECEDLRFEGFTVRHSPGWTFELLNCDRVFANGVRVQNHFWGPNTDAFDICGCRDVMITNCHIVCGDDAFCVKTMPHTRSAERITITNCTMRTNCVGLKLGCFESHGDMRQITFSNNVVYNSSRAVGIYNFKGATFEDILISNLVCDDENELHLNRPIHLDLRHETERGWGGVSPTGHAGIIRRVQIQNVVARTRGRILLTNADGGRMEDILLRDVTLAYDSVEDPGAVFSLTRSAQFSNHSPEAQLAKAALVADGVERLQVHNLNIRWPEAGGAHGFAAGWFRHTTSFVDSPLARGHGETQAWIQAE